MKSRPASIPPKAPIPPNAPYQEYRRLFNAAPYQQVNVTVINETKDDKEDPISGCFKSLLNCFRR